MKTASSPHLNSQIQSNLNTQYSTQYSPIERRSCFLDVTAEDAHQRSLEELKQELQTKSQELQEKSQELQNSSVEIDRILGCNSVLLNEVDSEKVKTDKLTAQLARLQEQCSSAAAELNQLQKKEVEYSESNKRELASLREALKTETDKCKLLKIENSKLKLSAKADCRVSLSTSEKQQASMSSPRQRSSQKSPRKNNGNHNLNAAFDDELTLAYDIENQPLQANGLVKCAIIKNDTRSPLIEISENSFSDVYLSNKTNSNFVSSNSIVNSDTLVVGCVSTTHQGSLTHQSPLKLNTEDHVSLKASEADMKKDLFQLEETMISDRKRIQQLDAVREQLRQEVHLLQESEETLKLDCVSLREQLEFGNAQIKALSDSRDSLMIEVEHCKKKVALLTKSQLEWEDRVRALDLDIKAEKEKSADVNSQLHDREHDIEALSQKLFSEGERFKESLSKLREDLNVTLVEREKELTTVQIQLENQRRSSTELKNNLEWALDDAHSSIEKLESVIRVFETELALKSRELLERTLLTSDLQKELDSSKAEMEASRKLFDESLKFKTEELSVALSGWDELKDTAKTLTKKMHELERGLEASEQSAGRAACLVKEKEQEIERINRALHSERETYNLEVNNKCENYASVKAEHDAVADELARTKTTFVETVVDHERTVEALKTEVEHLRISFIKDREDLKVAFASSENSFRSEILELQSEKASQLEQNLQLAQKSEELQLQVDILKRMGEASPFYSRVKKIADVSTALSVVERELANTKEELFEEKSSRVKQVKALQSEVSMIRCERDALQLKLREQGNKI